MCVCVVMYVRRNTFYLNSSMHAHRAFTTLLSAIMRAALLWFGGAALFADRTTVSAHTHTHTHRHTHTHKHAS